MTYKSDTKSLVTPTYLPEIQTPMMGLDDSVTPLVTSKPTCPTFLNIPVEIRLQIFSYLLHTHPIRHAHLSLITTSSIAPLYVSEQFLHTTIHSHGSSLEYAGFKLDTSSASPWSRPPSSLVFDARDRATDGNSSTSHQTVNCRTNPVPQGKIPTGLLVSCKQVYFEARSIPFQDNQFAFVNWFWSGIYAARRFSRGLSLWQSEAIRWTAVEVLGRDLCNGSLESSRASIGGLAGASLASSRIGSCKGIDEWVDLCRFWKGVWGLRLGIKGRVILTSLSMPVGSMGWNGELDVVAAPSSFKDVRQSILDTDLGWIQKGLLLMNSLRCIRIEIEDDETSRDTKILFCRNLKYVLNKKRDRSDGWLGDVQVVFVERIIVEEEPAKDFVWYGGRPEDGSSAGPPN